MGAIFWGEIQCVGTLTTLINETSDKKGTNFPVRNDKKLQF